MQSFLMHDIFYNYLPILFYFTLLYFTIKKHTWFFILFFYLFMQQIKNILSNYFVNVNAPVFMREVEKYSDNDLSLLVLTVFYSIGIFALIFVYKVSFKKKLHTLAFSFLHSSYSKNKIKYIRLFNYFVFFIIIILILHILAKNTPLLNESINKNNYWTDYALFPKIKIISSQLGILLFISGYFYARQSLFKKEKYHIRIFYFIIVFLSIFYYILMKQKFGGPLLMLFSFYLPYFLIGLYFKLLNIKKLVFSFSLAIFLLVGTVYGYFYMKFGNDAGLMIAERVFSLQSEIWEVTFQYFMNQVLPFDKNEFINELSILFGFNEGYTGMQYVMSKVMEADYFNFFIDIHINLSSAYPSYLFYLFSDPLIEFPFILIVNFILYCSYFFSGFYVIYNIFKDRIIIAAISLKIFYAFKDIISQVYLDSIFTTKILFYLLLIILLKSKQFNNFLNIFTMKKVSNEKNIIY